MGTFSSGDAWDFVSHDLSDVTCNQCSECLDAVLCTLDFVGGMKSVKTALPADVCLVNLPADCKPIHLSCLKQYSDQVSFHFHDGVLILLRLKDTSACSVLHHETVAETIKFGLLAFELPSVKGKALTRGGLQTVHIAFIFRTDRDDMQKYKPELLTFLRHWLYAEVDLILGVRDDDRPMIGACLNSLQCQLYKALRICSVADTVRDVFDTVAHVPYVAMLPGCFVLSWGHSGVIRRKFDVEAYSRCPGAWRFFAQLPSFLATREYNIPDLLDETILVECHATLSKAVVDWHSLDPAYITLFGCARGFSQCPNTLREDAWKELVLARRCYLKSLTCLV